MLVSDFIIKRILDKIRKLNHYDNDDIDMMRYGLETILWEIEKTLILFIVFALLGHQYYFLATLTALTSIRFMAGGYHSKTALSCLIVSLIGFFLAILVLPQVPLNDFGFILLSIFSLFVTCVAAPMRSVEKEAIQQKNDKKQKKLISFIITSLWLILIYINKTNTYALPILWIIVQQNILLLFEYLKRKEKINVK